MKINLSNHIPLNQLSHKNGFGYAAEHIEKSLRNVGYDIGEENADVQIWWDQPHWIEWDKSSYHIAYFPWESTKLPPGWIPIVNSADEIWTPSEFIASWLRKIVTPPVYVYEHGVDHIWTPKKRERPETLKFLNLGFEAARKFGPQTLQSFRAAFANREDVSLTIKTHMPSWKIEYTGKVNLLNQKLSIEELVQLFLDHEVFVFVSAGEGFGLPPLQALATGMPSIINNEWAPYREFTDPNLKVESRVYTSPWVDIHPGKMLRPDFDEFVDRMRWIADNYDQASEFAFTQASLIHSHYSWDRLTKEAFTALESRLK